MLSTLVALGSRGMMDETTRKCAKDLGIMMGLGAYVAD